MKWLFLPVPIWYVIDAWVDFGDDMFILFSVTIIFVIATIKIADKRMAEDKKRAGYTILASVPEQARCWPPKPSTPLWQRQILREARKKGLI